MKTLIKIILIAIILYCPFNWAEAGLVPCATEENPDPCTLCHLIVGFYVLISYGLRILIFAAFTVLVIAGVMYFLSAGSEQMITSAKNAIKFTLTGVGFVLAGWLLVFVVMNYFGVKDEAGNNLGIQKESWFKFKCSTQSTAGTLGAGGAGGGATKYKCNSAAGECVAATDGTVDSKDTCEATCGVPCGAGLCKKGWMNCPTDWSKVLFETCSGAQTVCCKKN